jgi:hypothetical protein
MGITEPVLSGKILLFRGSGILRIRPSSACIKMDLLAMGGGGESVLCGSVVGSFHCN